MVKIAFANEIINGFEEKEKREKENLKIKVFIKLQILFLGTYPKLFIFI